MEKSGLEDGGDMKVAVKCAENARKDRAGYWGDKPPDGPKPEPVKLNGVPAIKDRGLTK